MKKLELKLKEKIIESLISLITRIGDNQLYLRYSTHFSLGGKYFVLIRKTSYADYYISISCKNNNYIFSAHLETKTRNYDVIGRLIDMKSIVREFEKEKEIGKALS